MVHCAEGGGGLMWSGGDMRRDVETVRYVEKVKSLVQYIWASGRCSFQAKLLRLIHTKINFATDQLHWYSMVPFTPILESEASQEPV